MSDDLLLAIKDVAERTSLIHNTYVKKLASECAKMEGKQLRLRIVSNYTIDQLTELFLQGYTLTPPSPPRGLMYEFKWHRRLWRWFKRMRRKAAERWI